MAIRRLRPPPAIKVLEAAGAIADGRVRIVVSRNNLWAARVSSSGRPLEYRVYLEVSSGGEARVYSSDNGTIYRGYVGYPIISLMMLAGLLPRDAGIEERLKGINWFGLNRRYKSYGKVMEVVLAERAPEPGLRREIEGFMYRVMSLLRRTRLYLDESLPQTYES